ncbi:MAG: ribonuclease E/G, partial [Pseudomonadota bacterium]
EEVHASYAMAEQADTDIGYSKSQKEEVKPRQEAMVKSITPDTAPLVERKEVTAAPALVAQPASEGFFAKIFSFFFSKPAEAVVVAPVVEEKPRHPRDKATGDRNNRNRGRNGRGRDREDRPANPRADKDDANKVASPEQAQTPVQQQRQPKQARPPREEREGQEPRRDRQPRQRGGRKDNATPDAKAEDALLSVVSGNVPTQGEVFAPASAEVIKTDSAIEATAPGVNETAEQAEEGRRRRRRGGRNRNRRDRETTDVNEHGEASSKIEGADAQPVFIPVAELVALEPVSAPVAAPAIELPTTVVLPAEVHAVVAEPMPAAVQATVVETPAPTPTPAPVEVLAPVQASLDLVPTPVVETVEAVALVAEASPAVEPLVAAIVAPVVTPAIAAIIAPITAPAAPIEVAVTEVTKPAVVAPAPMPIEGLNAMLNQAGLALAGTDPEKLRAAQAAAALIVPPVRVPRERKPVVPVSSEPLVLMETKK